MILSLVQSSASSFSLRLPALPAVVRRVLPDLTAVLALAWFAYLAYIHYGHTLAAMDIGVYSSIAARADGLVKGTLTSVESEYPPLATALFWMAQSLNPHGDFAAPWLVVIVVSSVCAWAYLRCFSRFDAALFAFVLPVSTVLLGHDMVFARFDIFVCLLLILCVRAHAHHAYAESAAWLSLAIALKIVPVLALPVLIAATPRRHWKWLVFGMACATFVGITLSVGVLGFAGMIDNIQYVLGYHSGRPVQLESLWSGLSMLHALALGRVIHTGYQNMSVINVDVAHQSILLAKILVVTGLGYVLYSMWKVGRCRDAGALLSVVLLWALAVSPVLSPQYFTWVIPLAFVVIIGRFFDRGVSPRGIFAIGLTILVAYLTKWIFPANYNALIDQETLPMIILNVRNGALLVLTYLMMTDAGIAHPLHHYLPKHVFMGAKRTFFADTILAGIAVFILLSIRPALMTGTQNSGYFSGGHYQILDSFPFTHSAGTDTVTVMTDMTIPYLAQHRFFRLRPDDCIEAIFVNGMEVPPNRAQFCDGSGPGRIFDFGPYTRTGHNTLSVVVRNTGGPMGLDLIPSVTPLLFLSLLVAVAVTLWYLVQCYRLYCELLLSPTEALTAEMIYTRAVSWITSRLPAKVSLIPSADGQVPMSI